MGSQQRPLTVEQLQTIASVEGAYRLTRGHPDQLLAERLRIVELERALGLLRGADEPLGVAVVEILLGDLYAAVREMERAVADAEDAERKRQERADVLDAPRQVAALEADGGASDLTIEEWLAYVSQISGDDEGGAKAAQGGAKP
jgi:hypothetical protein